MKTSAEILTEIDNTLNTSWKTREGRKIPENEDVQLGNDAVTLTGTVLYADMADSTSLVDNFKDWFAAEIYKSYLSAACHIIRNNNGVITAFDGDRVMAVFIGDRMNSAAAKSALQINYIVNKLNAKISKAYPTSSYVLRQTIGIDTSNIFVARTGIRDNNDLVWVSKAANYAAKLSSVDDSENSMFITDPVFKKLSKDTKYGSNQNILMWEKGYNSNLGLTIYKSNWYWEF